MPLEDDFCDIIKKARVGQGLSVDQLARTSRLPGTTIADWERGSQPRSRPDVAALATALGLRPEPLAQIVLDKWEPMVQPPPAWLEKIGRAHV